MGKAQIIEALGEGRYTIRILEARERAEAIKGQALSRISAINAEISDLDAQIASAQGDVDAAVTAEQNGIEQYRQEMADDGVRRALSVQNHSFRIVRAGSMWAARRAW